MYVVQAVIGRVRFDERQIVMDALCNSCIHDYEQSIVKKKKQREEYTESEHTRM